MSAEVERFDGTVAQYVGDELYAVFGAPVAHEDDSERAVRAALAIQRALARYADEVEAAYGVDSPSGSRSTPARGRHPAEDSDGITRTTRSATPSTSRPASRSWSRAARSSSGADEAPGRGRASSSRSSATRSSRASAPVETFRVTGVRDRKPPCRNARSSDATSS